MTVETALWILQIIGVVLLFRVYHIANRATENKQEMQQLLTLLQKIADDARSRHAENQRNVKDALQLLEGILAHQPHV